MTTMMLSNLPRDLIENIFSRVPLKSMKAIRLTCKSWNILSKSEIFTKMHIAAAAATREGESMMIAMMDYNLYLMTVTIDNNVDPSIKLIVKLSYLNKQVKISKVFHCEGLLLCILKDNNEILVWNPYLEQTRWIIPRYPHRSGGMDRYSYALGYENKKSGRSLKFLRFLIINEPRKRFFAYEIYYFDSDLWKTLDVTPHCHISFLDVGVSLKGNTYWGAKESNSSRFKYTHIICFDFTRERFGPLLPLPFSGRDNEYEYMTLSCVREEKLAALFQHTHSYPFALEIWITTKIEVQVLSWSKFLRMETGPDINVPYTEGVLFIDKEKKVAMGFNNKYRERVNIIGEAGYFKRSNLPKIGRKNWEPRRVCSYVPSLVQIKKPAQKASQEAICSGRPKRRKQGD